MFLTPYRGERPPTAEVTQLDFDEPWTKAPELQTLGLVMEQDTFNMEAVQRGLETTRRPYVITSTLQEAIVSWRHDLLTDVVERPVRRRRAVTELDPQGGAIRHPLIPNAYYSDNGDGTVPRDDGHPLGPLRRRTAAISKARCSRPIRSCASGSPRPRPTSHHRISRVLDMPAER